MTASISPRQLASLAGSYRMVPITRTLFADSETPVGVYRKLAHGRPGTFLLESAEPGRSFSRWSFVGVNAVAALTVVDGQAAWTGDVQNASFARMTCHASGLGPVGAAGGA